jgi:hypothetical protein
MDDGVQLVDASALKCKLRQLRAVESAVRRKDFPSEFTHNLIEDGLAWLHHLASEDVGFNDLGAERAQVGGDSRFAAAESTGETYAEHESETSAHFGCADGVGHEHGDGEWANPTGNGRVGASALERLGMDVSDDGGSALEEGCFTLGIAGEEAIEIFTRGDAIDTNIDKCGATLDHFRSDEAGTANGGYEDIGLARDFFEVASLGVTYGDGGVVVEKEHGSGFADNVTAADDDGMLTSDGNMAALEDLNDTGRRAGRESGAACLEAPGVHGVKSVNILCWVNRVEQGFGVNLGGQRKLDEDTVNVVTGVESGDEVEHFSGGYGGGWRDEVAVDAKFGTGLHLAADVNLRGGDIAYEDRRETGTDALPGENADFFSNFLLDCGGNRNAVEND